MELESAATLALRLLELEQRFESYWTLHEEETREIKATLDQLRAEILSLNRNLLPTARHNTGRPSPSNSDPSKEVRDSLQVLAL
jgi:hypothetical protein